MATSGNVTWQLNRDEIVSAALRKLGVLAEGQVATTEQITYGSQALNGVVALFQAKGMPLWKRETQVIIPVAGVQTYTITDSPKVAQVVLVYTTGGTQYELIEKSLYDFNELPDGVPNPGVPVHYMFQPGIQSGTLKIWPAPTAEVVTQNEIHVVKQKKFDGFFNATETPDFPSFYTDALIYSLAVRLAPEYGVPLGDRGILQKEASYYTEEAFSYGDEDGSLYFQVDPFFGRN